MAAGNGAFITSDGQGSSTDLNLLPFLGRLESIIFAFSADKLFAWEAKECINFLKSLW